MKWSLGDADLKNDAKDSEAAANKKTRCKQINFPDIDDDGLPSGYTVKVLTSIGKWQLRMDDLKDKMDVKNDTMKSLLWC